MSSFRVFASCLIVSFALYQIQLTYGYGILQLFPPARGSLWRMNLSRTSIDYNDEYMNCGGFANQYFLNGGQCGVCGDNFSTPTPRPHEIGGAFWDNDFYTIYRQVQIAHIRLFATELFLNANVSFDLCDVNDLKVDKYTQRKIEDNDCFQRLTLVAPPPAYVAKVGPLANRGFYDFYVQMPYAKMNRGILRTTAITAKNYGYKNGKICYGCGPGYETFRICSNVGIAAFYDFSVPDFSGKFVSPQPKK